MTMTILTMNEIFASNQVGGITAANLRYFSESVLTDILKNESDIADLRTDVTTLQTDNTTNQTNISTLQTDLGTAESNIATLINNGTPGLIEVLEDINTGWRIKNHILANHGIIGQNAIDLSQNDTISSTKGATGQNSVTLNFGTTAQNEAMTAIGKFNVGTDINTIFEVGIGAASGSEANGLEVYLDGTATLPEATIAEIDTRGTKAIVTQEYLQANSNLSELEKITEGVNTGWRLRGMDPANFGDIGSGSIDLSTSTTPSTTFGATGLETLALGYETTSSGWAGIAAGYRSVASANTSFAFGENCISSQDWATAFGNGSQATNYNAFAAGQNCVASGRQAVAMGEGTQAQGNWSTAIGNYCTASATESVAIGANATASGGSAVALGYYTTAGGGASVALGNYTTATGNNSFAVGYVTTALNANSVAMGAYNVGTDVNTIFEFGIGSFGAEANALELYLDGSLVLPAVTPAEIEAKGLKAVITKEYLDGYTAPNVHEETGLISYTPDFDLTDFFEYTLTQNTTINNPLNMVKGHKGELIIKQDATGGWTTTFGANWIFPNGAPTLNTLAGKINFIRYTVVDVDKILAEFIADL